MSNGSSDAGLMDMTEIPKWFDDPEAPRPCPCGRPPYGPMILIENQEGAKMMLHAECAAQAGLMEDDE